MFRKNKAEFRQLGINGPSVFPISLGCMGMSQVYGPADDNESIATIHKALDEGINLIDTGDFYGMGHNEMLIGRALKGHRDKAMLSVKFGPMRSADGKAHGIDTRPMSVKNFLAYTLTRLGVDHIDIYRPARLDPEVPIEDTVGAIADLVKTGYVRYIGLSEVGPETIRRAQSVHPISDLQIEYSLITRGPEKNIFPVLRELGIGVTAYAVLSRGLLSGSSINGTGDYRANMPRFMGKNLVQNRKLFEKLGQIAKDLGITPPQLAIAWVLAKDKFIVPVLGARKRKQLNETLGALKVRLTADNVKHVEEAIPAAEVAGTRYGESQMKTLDSEDKK
jgi:aryl-alcohol dehydrogenase-like predicted oxidoreductase